ncbi:DUF1176 domain-containing protein [Roseibium denhamense]|uniref:DUF1176 domain-containing protein n=1 Tax=Roseibium denhamense TaxID=76305 RepID=A0ABY1NFP8_9HYPH|nr:DUF1176 domain-containing protein [Roseibium denhamense]SMP07743.1 Protein of unknown function [Roseibium denhamense]
MRLRICLVAGGLAGLCAPVQAELARTAYLDWTVRCTDENYCIAETPGTGDSDEAFRLKVERGAKPDSNVFVTFAPESALQTGMTARIEVWGEEENYAYFGVADTVYKGNEMAFSGSPHRDLVEQLRLGSEARIQIEFGGAAGTQSYYVSLSGLTQAMLRIDEEQGRVGRGDAIVAWGGKPSDAGPQPNTSSGVSPSAEREETKPEPRQTADSADAAEAAAPRAAPAPAPAADPVPAVFSGGDWNSTYEERDVPDAIQRFAGRALGCTLEETLPAYGAFALAFGDVEYWMVPCEMGDTNPSFFLMSHVYPDPDAGEIYNFKNPRNGIREDAALLFNMDFRADEDIVTGTTYYGPGYDCGMYEVYKFNRTTDVFDLIEIREKPKCDGQTAMPADWPRS